MAETPIRPSRGNNSGTPVPPGTVMLFPNTPIPGPRSKRVFNNKNTNTPNSKLQRKIIITDYNPNEVMEITEDNQQKHMIVKKINDVTHASKFFYNPSSFLCKLETDKGFTKLCIHKFNDYDSNNLTTPTSYTLHQNLYKLLQSIQKPAYDIKNINSAFKSLKQSQTLLINLHSPVNDYTQETMQHSLYNTFELRQITPVIIGDSNSVVIYNPGVNYGRNNNHNNRNSMREPKTSKRVLANNDGSLGSRPFTTNSREGTVLEGVFNNNYEWSPSMATPPAEGAAAAIAEGEPASGLGREETGSPTQRMNATARENNGTPTQHNPPHNAARGSHIPVVNFQLPLPPLQRANAATTPRTPPRTPPRELHPSSPSTSNGTPILFGTPMLHGGRTNKKNRKVSKKTKRINRKSKKENNNKRH